MSDYSRGDEIESKLRDAAPRLSDAAHGRIQHALRATDQIDSVATPTTVPLLRSRVPLWQAAAACIAFALGGSYMTASALRSNVLPGDSDKTIHKVEQPTQQERSSPSERQARIVVVAADVRHAIDISRWQVTDSNR